jgi:hypothetical protein
MAKVLGTLDQGDDSGALVSRLERPREVVGVKSAKQEIQFVVYV